MARCIANRRVDGPLYWLAEGGAGPSWRSAGAWIPAGPARQARTSALTITHTVIGPVAELGPLYEPRTVTFVDSLPWTSIGKIDKKALRQGPDGGQPPW